MNGRFNQIVHFLMQESRFDFAHADRLILFRHHNVLSDSVKLAFPHCLFGVRYAISVRKPLFKSLV